MGVVDYKVDGIHCQHDLISIDMRKPLPRDTKRETVRDNGEKVLVHPEELEPWR